MHNETAILETRLTPDFQFGVYSDPECTVEVKEINWGSLRPGERKEYGIYVKNNGYSHFNLALSTQNWNPPTASDYISLSWDYDGRTLRSRKVLPLKLTLAVASDISEITNFSFDIVITATSPPLLSSLFFLLVLGGVIYVAKV